MATHTNSQRERIEICTCLVAPFIGRSLLVLHDDPPSQVRATMLLDSDTVRWLREQLDLIERSGRT